MASDTSVRKGEAWTGGAYAAEPSSVGRELSISNVLGMCKRHILLLAIWVGLFTVATGAIVYTLQPRYRAEATLIIDTRLPQISTLKSAVSTPFTTQETAPVMRSEVQILDSPGLAAQVIQKLNLAAAPSFQDHPSAMAARTPKLRELCSAVVGDACARKPEAPDDATRALNRLVDKYLGRLTVFNDGRSFSLSVTFQDPDPKLAAAIVNAHVETYLADQRAFKRQASIAGVTWIDEQLKKLGGVLASKQKELQAVRDSSGLISTKGATVVAQQVSDINAQLIQARADLAQREARLPGTQGGRVGGAAVQSEVLNSPLIQALRGQEATARQSLQDLAQIRGPDFPGVQQAKARVDEIDRRIASETSRIIAANSGDVSVASKRVSELEHALATLQTQLINQDQASSRVAVMERDLEGTRTVYQGLLERQQELEVQAGTEEPDARLVSSASEPLAPFFPNKTIMLSLGMLLGTVSAVGVVFMIDKPERGIQLPSQVQGILGMHALTPLPQVKDRRKRKLADYLLDMPKSEFAEAIHSLRGDIAALQQRGGPVKVLAISSALPEEGKTSVATALARSMVVSGLHVLLVDCDLRRSSVGAAVNVRPGQRGIISVLKGASSLSQAVVKDSRTPLDLLLVEQPVNMPQDLLSSRSFAAMVAKARASYDFVVLDTPPQGAVSDPLVIAAQADATVLAVRWNATPPTVVRWTLEAFGKRGLLPQGVFLNRVDYPSLTRKDPDHKTAYRSTRSYYLKS